MKKLFLICFFSLVTFFAQAQTVKEIGEPYNELGTFGFRYYIWKVTFTDGTKGKFYQNQKNGKYFIIAAFSTDVYYTSKDAAIKAAYYFEKDGKAIQEGRD